MQGAKPRIGFQEMETNFGKLGERKKNSEERQTRLARVGGLNSKGHLEQRRHGWNQAGDKPSYFDRGHTDRFKAQCPICLEKEKRWTSTNMASKTKGGAVRK